MHRKKVFAGVMSILMTAALVMPASAHGHHGGSHHGCTPNNSVQSTAVSVCPFDDCDAPGQHSHDGVTYCGYAHSSGVCDGNCLELCTVEGCTSSGQHTHDGVAYCGYAHTSGYAKCAHSRSGCHGRFAC